MKDFIKHKLREGLDKQNIEYRFEHLDSYDGQDNYELGMYINNEIIGMVEYITYNGVISVSNIIVRPEYRRKGYGSKMMKAVKQKHPEFKYEPSFKTDLGAKFKHKDVDLYENKYLNEAVDQFNYDSEKPSPTVSWDIVQDNIDKSVSNIKTEDDVEDYLTSLSNKLKGLSPKIKKRLKKYAITALIGVVGIGTFNNVIADMNSEVVPNKIDLVNNPQKVDHSTNNPKIGDRGLSHNIPNKVSSNLIQKLKYHEGSAKSKGEPVLKAYKLNDGKITVGWGHAEPIKTSRFKNGQRIDRKTAEKLFKKDLLSAKATIDDIFSDWKDKDIEYNISQGMYDAMISMAFNMGRQGFRNTEFIQLVKQGKYKEAKERIKTTNVSYEGHKSRREDESNMFDITDNI